MAAELYWIDARLKGRLAVMPRPRGYDWLEDEMRSMKQSGVDLLVSLLTSDETAELGLDQESTLCESSGIEFVTFPIIDRNVPDSTAETLSFVECLYGRLDIGENIAIHCRAGIGRSALIAACVLVRAGQAADLAFDLIGDARGLTVPDTLEQREWVIAIQNRLQSST